MVNESELQFGASTPPAGVIRFFDDERRPQDFDKNSERVNADLSHRWTFSGFHGLGGFRLTRFTEMTTASQAFAGMIWRRTASLKRAVQCLPNVAACSLREAVLSHLREDVLDVGRVEGLESARADSESDVARGNVSVVANGRRLERVDWLLASDPAFEPLSDGHVRSVGKSAKNCEPPMSWLLRWKLFCASACVLP